MFTLGTDQPVSHNYTRSEVQPNFLLILHCLSIGFSHVAPRSHFLRAIALARSKCCVVVHGCELRFDASHAPAMEKQNATGSNTSVRVPPKIKIKALEAVKVGNLVAAHKCLPESLCRRACHTSGLTPSVVHREVFYNSRDVSLTLL